MKQEIRLFLAALQFYTRIPVGRWLHTHMPLSEATKYLPAVGWVTGFASGVALTGTALLFGTPLAAVLSMAASVLLTGALHEDGFADFCDGFGGGWTKERILDIMKDSRTGSYGVAGLVLLLLTRFLALCELSTMLQGQAVPFILLLITAHAVSRFAAASFLFTHPYVRPLQSSKAGEAAVPVRKSAVAVCILLAAVPFTATLFITRMPLLFWLIPVLALLRFYLGRYFSRWIGGYTGDCLGAAQQLTEVAAYLTFIALWKFS